MNASLINTEILPFKATAFHNGKFVEVSDESLKGEWSVIVFMPAAFTFNCPTEVEDAADNYDEFQKAGAEVYTAEITYPKDREHLLLRGREVKENQAGFGFHYDPYNFDSNPERDFFEAVLRELNLHPGDVEDVYFTGGITDPAKTDFHVEYRGEDGR